jgi:hypothetical protein
MAGLTAATGLTLATSCGPMALATSTFSFTKTRFANGQNILLRVAIPSNGLRDPGGPGHVGEFANQWPTEGGNHRIWERCAACSELDRKGFCARTRGLELISSIWTLPGIDPSWTNGRAEWRLNRGN